MLINYSSLKWITLSFLVIYTINPLFSHSACELFIDRVVVGDCEFGPRTGNKSKVIVAVFLRWNMPPPGTMIVVRLKGQSKNFDPFDRACPPYVQFVLDPDGSTQQIQANFNLLSNCVASPVNITLPQACDPPTCLGASTIGGKVFLDFNNNGIQELSEIGIPDVPINIYDDLKNRIGSTTSKVNGIWSIQNLVAGTKVRVEFDVAAKLFDSNIGMDNRTRTQRSTVGSCDANLGVFALESVIEENPWIVTAVMSKGTPSNPQSNAFLNPAIVANQFNTGSGGPRAGPNGNYNIVSAAEVGSIWGLAYQKETKSIFSGAFLKRNAQLGPAGLGAIYVTDLNSFLPNPIVTPGFRYYGNTKLLLNLDSFGIQTGDETRLRRDIKLNSNDASHDSTVYDLVGKWGLADLDLNDRGDTLFAINMHNRSLIIIHVGNPYVLPITKDRITEIPIPSSSCSVNSDWRPWGIKYKDGSLYVGGLCNAEFSKNPQDLVGTIYKFSNSTFTKLTQFDLFYDKGSVAGTCRNFKPWSNSFYYYNIGGDQICGPVPIVSDIEFDSEGNMLVAIGDRLGYQTGGRDFGTKRTDNVAYISFAGGDLLKFFKLKDEYLLEKNATVGFYTTGGANNTQGICNGEFFYQDGYFGHEESVLGALAIHPSYNTVLTTMMDPDQIWSNGWSQMENSKGEKKVNYNIFTGESGTFGKSAGLGDIEIMVGSSTPKGIGVSIGNFIWEDLDADGLQDPGEPPIVNLPVLIFDNQNKQVNSTKTDLNGEFYFKNLTPYTNYYIQLGNDIDYFKNELLHNKKLYSPTKLHNILSYGNFNNDSDAELILATGSFFKDKIALNYITGDNGENDFSLDFGLIRCTSQIRDTVFHKICSSDSIQIDSTWFSLRNPEGEIVFKSGSYFGCDSILRVELSFVPNKISQWDTSICKKEQILLHGVVFNETNPSGQIVLPHASSEGCDSVVNIQLKFLPDKSAQLDTAICSMSQILLHGTLFNENNSSGQIVLAGASSLGCDSLLNVNVSFHPLITTDIKYSICKNDSIIIHKVKFDSNNIQGAIQIKDRFGCDSTLKIQIDLLEPTTSRIDTAACRGSELKIHNISLSDKNPDGQVILKNSSTNGCDSTILFHLRIKEATSSFLDTSICEHFNVTIHNKVFGKNRPRDSILLFKANNEECDSIIYVNVNFIKQPYLKIDTVVCASGNVLIDQQVFNKNKTKGQLIYPSQQSQSCDSVVDVNLTLLPEYLKVDSLEACDEFYWNVDGITYYSDQNLEFKALTRLGCDSTHKLFLRIYPSFRQIDSACTINQYNWKINGNQYKESGFYEARYFTSHGCDSLRFLFLEILGEGEVYVPNVFSPNGDGINDKLTVFANKDVKSIDVFRVFDRWGELMYELKDFMPNNTSLGWDAIFHGELVNPAVFVHYVEWRDKLGGIHYQYGDVTLVR